MWVRIPCVDRTRHSDNIEDLLGTVFYIGDPDVIMSCLTWSILYVWLRLRNASSWARHWQTQLSDVTTDDSLHPSAVQTRTGGSYVEKPAETQTSIRLASHLVKGPHSFPEDVSSIPLRGQERSNLITKKTCIPCWTQTIEVYIVFGKI